MLRLSQLQALKILETIAIRLADYKNSMRAIMIAIDCNTIQFHKARRQGLELIKDFDKYAQLANRIIEKYLSDVTNCAEIDELTRIIFYYNRYKAYFQN